MALMMFCVPCVGLCPDWETWDPVKPVANATEAMQLADDWLGIPQVRTADPLFSVYEINTRCFLCCGFFPAKVKGQLQQLCLVS